MMETKDYTLTCGEVIDNLLLLADAYEKASAGKAPSGFAFNPTDAAANMKAAVHFIGSFGQQIPQWIPVSERLPEPDFMGNPVGVLVCLPGGEVCIGFCDNDEHGVRWHCQSTQRPTHWMPLPPPPSA
jgi:hypothetical protein